VEVKRAFGIVLGRAPSAAELERYTKFSGDLRRRFAGCC
jgi:hypothetical protein